MSEALRCFVADDHPALVAAVSAFLAKNGFEVVGTAADGPSTLNSVRELRPAVALVDNRMPRLDGPDLITRLSDAAPETLLVVYTALGDERLVRSAFDAGAHAVVLKDAPLDDLIRALEAITAGRRYVDPALAREALNGSRPGALTLTIREIEVLGLLAEGLSHEEIGSRLSIGSETVRTHVRKASTRLGARTRTQAVATALRLGLIT